MYKHIYLTDHHGEPILLIPGPGMVVVPTYTADAMPNGSRIIIDGKYRIEVTQSIEQIAAMIEAATYPDP